MSQRRSITRWRHISTRNNAPASCLYGIVDAAFGVSAVKPTSIADHVMGQPTFAAEAAPGAILSLAAGALHPRASKAGRWRELRSKRGARSRDLSSGTLFLDHLIRSQQQRRRDGEAERLGGLEVDHELELLCLLYANVGLA